MADYAGAPLHKQLAAADLDPGAPPSVTAAAPVPDVLDDAAYDGLPPAGLSTPGHGGEGGYEGQYGPAAVPSVATEPFDHAESQPEPGAPSAGDLSGGRSVYLPGFKG